MNGKHSALRSAFGFLVMVAALFCIMIGSNEQMSLWDCLEKLRLWDANHYINLIDKGYSAYPGKRRASLSGILSLLRLVCRIAKLIIPSTELAGALVSALCFSWGVLLGTQAGV